MIAPWAYAAIAGRTNHGFETMCKLVDLPSVKTIEAEFPQLPA